MFYDLFLFGAYQITQSETYSSSSNIFSNIESNFNNSVLWRLAVNVEYLYCNR